MFSCRSLNCAVSSLSTSPVVSLRAELNSNADTCAFGDSAFIGQGTLQSASVSPFLQSFGSITDVGIVTAAIAYDCPETFTTFILHFPQSLYIPDFENALIAPNQLRSHRIVVNDTPLFALPPNQREADSPCILSQEHLLRIPLKLEGVISYFPMQKPSIDRVTAVCSFQNRSRRKLFANLTSHRVQFSESCYWYHRDGQATGDDYPATTCRAMAFWH
jgi:hypothetical protein